MARRKLSRGEVAYAAIVIAAGAFLGLRLLAASDPTTWDYRPILTFGSMALISTAVSFGYRVYKPTQTVHQIGSSFVYALFLLADPALSVLAFAAMSAGDWLLNRRRPAVGLFNLCQLWLALAAAFAVQRSIAPDFALSANVGAAAILAAVTSVLVLGVANQALTHGIVSIGSGTRFLRVDTSERMGFLNEFLCVVFGLCMAVLWTVNPALSVLGIIPIWILVFLLLVLSRREQALELQKAELQSLQGLGLEIGSELEAERLRKAVVRIVTEAFGASGALLAQADLEKRELRIVGRHGPRADSPAVLRTSAATLEVLEAAAISRIEEPPVAVRNHPELNFLGASGLLLAPVRIGERGRGLLVLFRDEHRRPFDSADETRLGTLVRFVEMALSNARLLEDVKEVQAQLIHTEKMSALGMLVSGVAHEVNNPLTSVLGYAQLLVRQESDPGKLRMLGKIASEAGRAGKIVQNLLTFSRKQTSEKKLTDINEVLDLVLDLQSYGLRVNNVEVIRRLSPGLPPVMADPHQVQQVFLNLLTNAEHALSDVGRKRRIVVETRLADGAVRISVSDNGPGIAQENLDRIFLPFFTTKSLGKGTGLGLAICYGIVEDHGGKIAAESRPGEGATFVVDLPAAVPDAGAAVEPEATDVPEIPSVPGRLLVVDDEETISDLVRDLLEPQGWTVETARDGSEALTAVGSGEFDVLLVDMRMPGMDGQTFYDAIRKTRPDLAERIVFATGDTGSENTSQFLAGTGRPVLSKPYEMRKLLELVSRTAVR